MRKGYFSWKFFPTHSHVRKKPKTLPVIGNSCKKIFCHSQVVHCRLNFALMMRKPKFIVYVWISQLKYWTPLFLYVYFLQKIVRSHCQSIPPTQKLQSWTKVLGTPGSDNWKMRWQAILETITNGITGVRNPLPPPTMLEMSNVWQLHHDKQHWIWGRGGKLINCLDRYWKGGQACQDFCRGL